MENNGSDKGKCEALMREHVRGTPMPEPVMPAVPMQKILRGQKALVTGASSGIGRAVAIALGEAGADVVVNYIGGHDGAATAVDEIGKTGSRAYAHQADVSDEMQVLEMFQRMKKEFGTIDILVNNAGLQQDAPIEELTLAQWNKVISVNLTGQFLCAREAVREFKRRGIRPDVSCAAGKIICMSSVHEVIPWAGHVNYAASKGGVMLMMKSIAQEVAPYRIRVNSISPGAIRTPINMQAWGTSEAYAELMKLIPYKRIGEPAEIGRAAAWLASDYADYITGVSLFIDGGMTLYPGFETGGAQMDASLTAPGTTPLARTLRRHWPEYLIEGWALGMFMVSAGVITTLFEAPASPVHAAIPDGGLRRALIGACMGLTAIALIYSPWGKRSGAHMNPAVTLAFWRLGKVATPDALFYVAAQFVGGTLGVLLVAALLGAAFTAPPVSYAATMPGPGGPGVAFGAELLISFVLMAVILAATASPRLAPWTGVFAGLLVAGYIGLEAPLSGMSMNPARSFASAAPGGMWAALWVYFTAPVLGMLGAASVFLALRGRQRVACAKLIHALDVRCIHCGYEPPSHGGTS